MQPSPTCPTSFTTCRLVGLASCFELEVAPPAESTRPLDEEGERQELKAQLPAARLQPSDAYKWLRGIIRVCRWDFEQRKRLAHWLEQIASAWLCEATYGTHGTTLDGKVFASAHFHQGPEHVDGNCCTTSLFCFWGSLSGKEPIITSRLSIPDSTATSAHDFTCTRDLSDVLARSPRATSTASR